MSSYELYEQMVDAFKNNPDGLNACEKNWIAEAEAPVFKEPEANELYGQAKIYWEKWNGTSIDRRVALRRMYVRINQLLEMDLPNPYPKEDVEKVSVKKNDVPVHVMGVVPEEEIKNEEPKEEKHFFGKKKSR